MALSTKVLMPEPARLLQGLRDTGYNFNTAIADIIDNSIAADATKVSVIVAQMLDNDLRVSIADNGYGMDHEALTDAMVYGAQQRDNVHSLGKFGLGLKTASTSCCRRLKVVSRSTGSDKIECAVWDLDFIAQKREWLLRYEEPTEDDLEELNAVAGAGSGTIVVWEKCDRLLSARYTNPDTKAYKAALERSIIELRQHIAMVYQRFLDFNDDRASNVEIRLNGESVEAWDPFCKEIAGPASSTEFEVLADDGRSHKMTLNCYIVPAKDELDTLEQRQRVMPSESNKSLKGFSEESLSGFYIYRENRLIHWGDWFNMPSIDFHNKLCRFELSFDAELDEAFQVDIKKSRIILNEGLRSELIEYVTPIAKEGNKRYRGTERKAAKRAVNMHENAQRKIAEQAAKTRYHLEENAQGDVVVTNKHGLTVTSFKSDSTGPVFKVEEGLTDGILWEPALIAGQNGVKVNGGHEFYKRFYGANRGNDNAVTALDCFLWALANAETQVVDKDAQDNLQDARYETSRFLRQFARTMPDVDAEDYESEE